MAAWMCLLLVVTVLEIKYDDDDDDDDHHHHILFPKQLQPTVNTSRQPSETYMCTEQ